MSRVIPSWGAGKLKTPQAVGPGWTCRLFRIPQNVEFLAAIFGALAPLTDPNQWDGSDGIGEEETAQYISEMLLGAEKDVCMVGDIFVTARGVLRENEMYCHGQVLSYADYPKLREVIHPYLKNDAAQNMRLPDLRGRVVMGVNYEPFENFSEENIEFNQETGQRTVTLSPAQMPTHTHTADPHTHTDAGHVHSVPNVIFNVDVEAPGVPDPIAAGIAPPTSSGIGYAQLSTETVNLQAAGESRPHNNIQPSLGLDYVIIVK